MNRQFMFLASAMLVFSAVESTSSQSLVQHVQVLSGSVDSVDSATFQVQKDSGKVAVHSRVLAVQIQMPSHQTVPEDVLIFYDPRSKAFWWDDRLPLELASGRLLPKNSALFVTDSKFVFFWNGWVSAGYIMILESSDHASSLQEGQQHVLRVLEERRADIEAGKLLREYKRVEFPSLDSNFLLKKNVANVVGPTLKAVSRVGNEWHIVEDGPNGGSALIVLNDNYEVIKTTLMPSK